MASTVLPRLYLAGTDTVAVGINEIQTGIACINDLSTRLNPKSEVKNPKLLADIHAIMEPHSESESSLRTTLLCERLFFHT